jgi:ketosteroid isomerase-like protein
LCWRSLVGVAQRKELVRQAFRALDAGDIAPFRELFDADAKWIGVPQRGEEDETPACLNRAAIVDRPSSTMRTGVGSGLAS